MRLYKISDTATRRGFPVLCLLRITFIVYIISVTAYLYTHTLQASTKPRHTFSHPLRSCCTGTQAVRLLTRNSRSYPTRIREEPPLATSLSNPSCRTASELWTGRHERFPLEENKNPNKPPLPCPRSNEESKILLPLTPFMVSRKIFQL